MTQSIIILVTPSEISTLAQYIPQAEIQTALNVIKTIIGDIPEFRQATASVTAKPKIDWVKYIAGRCDIIKSAPITKDGILAGTNALAELAGDVPATKEQCRDIQNAYAQYLRNVAAAVRNAADVDDALDGDVSDAGGTVRGVYETVWGEYMTLMAKVQADTVLTDLLNEMERNMDERDARWVAAAFSSMAR